MLAAFSLTLSESYAQTPELFLPAPESDLPPSLDALSAYRISSEMAVLNADSLSSDSLTAALLGNAYTISKDYVESRDDGSYSWFGSNEDGLDAVLVVDEGSVHGIVYAPGKTFQIFPVSGMIHEIYELNASRFPSSGVASPDGATGAQSTIDRRQIERLESAYIGDRDYDRLNPESIITIDVLGAVTTAGSATFRTDSMQLQLAIDIANRAYRQSDLPIKLNPVDTTRANLYDDAGNIKIDLANLNDLDNRAFSRAHALVERENADVLVLFVDDYTQTRNPNKDDIERENLDLNRNCAIASEQLAKGTRTALAVVDSGCIAAHSFTNAIGYLQGAGYDNQVPRNSEFSYGHGYFHEGADQRTIMATNGGNCDNPITDEIENCERRAIWSDPYENFFRTSIPAGSVDLNWNARVVFATAPHIASLRGDAATYDNTKPTGHITLPSTIPTSGTLAITATFSEEMHERFPPNITITDGATHTTATMTRTSPTTYMYDHILDGDDGVYGVLLSNGRDIFGNTVIKNPMSGGIYSVDASRIRADAVPPDAVYQIEEDFESGRLSDWRLYGDSNWRISTPFMPVPDTAIGTNDALVSEECRDECIIELRAPLNTEEPLTISFDRYVDRSVGGSEGLYVQYSIDEGDTWETLVSYTARSNDDVNFWMHHVVGLSIPQSSASIRFLADSNRPGDIVMIDNISISRPEHALLDVIISPPDAVAVPSSPAAMTGDRILLDASRSTDSDGDSLSYTWAQVPTGAPQVRITNPDSAVAEFTVPTSPDRKTVTFTFLVTVSDGTLTDTATVSVSASLMPAAPPPIAMDDFALYVANEDGRNVLVFETDGELIGEFASTDMGSINDEPHSLAFDSDGILFVGLRGGEIVRFDAAGNALGTFVDLDDRVYDLIFRGDALYAFTSSEVYQITGDGSAEFSVYGDATRRSGPDGLLNARGGDFGPDGWLYVLTINRSDQLKVYDTAGGFVRNVTLRDMAGSLITPYDMYAAPDGTFFVTSTRPDAVMHYDADFGLIQQISAEHIRNPHGITVGPDLRIYLVNDGYDNLVTIFAQGNQFASSEIVPRSADLLDDPNDVAVGPIPDLEEEVDPRLVEIIKFAEQFGNFNRWDAHSEWDIERPRLGLDADANNRVAHIEECDAPGDGRCYLELKGGDSVNLRDADDAVLRFWIYYDDDTRGDRDAGETLQTQGAMVQFRSAGTWQDLDMIRLQDMSEETWHERQVSLNPLKSGNGEFLDEVLVRFAPMLTNNDNIIQLDAVRIISQIIDDEPPRFSRVQDRDAIAPTPAGVDVSFELPRARDDIDGRVPVSCDTPDDDFYPIGRTVVTCEAQDRLGNAASASFEVNVTLIDRTPPTFDDEEATTLETIPQDILSFPVRFAIPTATDERDGPVGVECELASIGVKNFGDTQVYCSTQDSSGNSAGKQFTVTVERPALFDHKVFECPIDVALGETKTVSTSDCPGGHDDYYMERIHHTPLFGTAAITDDGLSFTFTAPQTMPTDESLLNQDETFRVNMHHSYPERPKIAVAVTLTEQ